MTSTIVGYTLLAGVAGGITYYYKPDLFRGFASAPKADTTILSESDTRPTSKRSKSKKSTSTKIGKNGSIVTGSLDSQSDEQPTISAPVNDTVTAKTASGVKVKLPRDDGGELGDKEFAQQLAKAQAGTKLQKPGNTQTKKERRATKQSQAKALETAEFSTEASSVAGQDADDDLSSSSSPSTKAVNGEAIKAGDVSDMLEAPTARPTTLRLTSIPDDNKNKKKASAKQAEPEMSKKKRNEQKRKDEMRAMKEESDRLHEAKKQEQLRKARTAAGTSNQTRANNFTSNANAWQSDKQTAAVKTAPAEPAPLLDTFEPITSTAKPNGAVNTAVIPDQHINTAGELQEAVGEKKASALGASSREALNRSTSNWADEMSEEDQMKLLKQQEDETAWESVTTKKSKKKVKQEDTGSEASSSRHRPAAAAIKQINGIKTNGVDKRSETVNRFDSFHTKSPDLSSADWEA